MAALPPGTEGLRLRRPIAPDGQQPAAVKVAQVGRTRKEPLIRELVNRTHSIFTPNFSTAFRLLILIRFAGAMYTSISDCDETYNYWEPLHYLVKGTGAQTWEYSPLFALRSWAYLLPHALPAWLAGFVFREDKRPAFFAVRISLALLSTLAECKMYRATVDHISPRAGRYFLSMVLFNAGMWNASTALLPSTFALHFTTLAYSFVLAPAASSSSQRTLLATLCFGLAAALGWPFAALLAIPFILEDLFLAGSDQIFPAARSAWSLGRLKRLAYVGVACLAVVVGPMVAIDSLAYGKLVLVPWNLVQYNVFAASSGRGPELFGTEPWTYYAFNLLLSHNYLFPLALLTLPAILFTRSFAPLRLHESKASKSREPATLNTAGTTTPPWMLLAFRAAPVYIWLTIVWSQPHKEERFLFPIYTLLCWNASVTLTLLRCWAEDLYLRATSSPYRTGKSSIFSTFTLTLLTLTTFLGVARILALQNYYHAPFDVMHHFQTLELPRLALESHPSSYAHLKLDPNLTPLEAFLESEKRIELSLRPLAQDNLTLCLGEQWYRFPTRWLLPDEVAPKFVKSAFDGILPRDFDRVKGTWLWRRGGSRAVREGFNDLNREETDRYVSKDECDYVLDLSFPHRPEAVESWTTSASSAAGETVEKVVPEAVESGKSLFDGLLRRLGSSASPQPDAPLESTSTPPPQKAGRSRELEKVFCSPMLDNQASSRLTRTLWMPFKDWQSANRWGELCLLRRRHRPRDRVVVG